jgi:hypothetical protein
MNSCARSTLAKQHTMSHGVDSRAIQTYASFWTQFRLLARRAAANSWRNQLILKGKAGQTVFLSLIVGLIYLNLGAWWHVQCPCSSSALHAMRTDPMQFTAARSARGCSCV